MQKKILITIIFITVTLIMGAWSMGMTASNPTFLKFYLIFIPLLIFQSLEFYFILKLKSNSKNKRILKLISVFILPIGMLLFLFISFGESKNKICFLVTVKMGMAKHCTLRMKEQQKVPMSGMMEKFNIINQSF